MVRVTEGDPNNSAAQKSGSEEPTGTDEFSPIAAYGGLGVGAVALAVTLVALLRGNKQ